MAVARVAAAAAVVRVLVPAVVAVVVAVAVAVEAAVVLYYSPMGVAWKLQAMGANLLSTLMVLGSRRGGMGLSLV